MEQRESAARQALRKKRARKRAVRTAVFLALAAALGAALVGVLCFTSDVTMLGVVQLLLYQLFWAIIVLAIGGSEKF